MDVECCLKIGSEGEVDTIDSTFQPRVTVLCSVKSAWSKSASELMCFVHIEEFLVDSTVLLYSK